MNLDSLQKHYVHELKDLCRAAQADRKLSRLAERTINFQAMV